MKEFLDTLFSRLAATFDPAQAGEVIATLVTGILIFLVVFGTYWVILYALNLAARPLLGRLHADPTSRAFATTVLKYSVLTVGFVHALDSAGINTAGIMASLGVVGLTIGFAARDALSNVVSGILIFWDRPFVLGDLVEIDGQYGRVDRITLRSTRVVTSDGRMLAVPNTSVINTTVASYTNFPNLRLDIPVTVGVNEDLGRARALLLGAVAASTGYLQEPAPVVRVTALNDYNVELRLEAWLENEREHIAARAKLREDVFEAFRSAGVEMPFETIQLQPVSVVQASG